MKWKTLGKISKKIVLYGFVGGIASIGYEAGYAHQVKPDSDVIFVDYVPYTSGTVQGAYNLRKDAINIFYTPDDYVYHTIVHELKHADNAKKFSYRLNTNADELSAFLATPLYNLGRAQRIDSVVTHAHRRLDELPTSAYVRPIQRLALEQLENNDKWANGTERVRDNLFAETLSKLHAERQALIDSIVGRFDGAVRDSLVRKIDQKYGSKSVADKIWGEYGEKLDTLYAEPKQMDKRVWDRDFNYQVPSLNQHMVDSIMIEALKQYSDVRDLYQKNRIAHTLYDQVHPMSDTDLEKLFTYKINGVHQSLFKMASPDVKSQIRRMANSDNLIFMAQRAFGRE